ncbi:MAG: CpaF family protein [Alphaproteobacteria bacterium]|nr:CpaF family protein [Alphaproteobacteria bacterium]
MFGRKSTEGKSDTPVAPVAAPSETPQAAPAASTAPSSGKAEEKGAARLVAQEVHASGPKVENAEAAQLRKAKETIYGLLMEQIDIGTASRLPREELKQQILDLIGDIVMESKMPITSAEQVILSNQILDDMLGFGPLEPLLKDPTVTDIMVNGPYQIYVEAKGKLTLSDIKFRDEEHVMAIATRIVTGVGRRVDESSPICDARLPDGSRVNVIAPPLSLKGTSISIRKFSEKKITLDVMARQKNVSDKLCKLLKIAAACRLNLIISGGTGSGKTTLLNAMSQLIDHGERVVTIEDAAELQLQQPHVVPLETRPPNLEGKGEITMRDLVKNALRMRPDRIILGEVRGAEAMDLLQAMNTGHDGSMGTLHANNPREALTRLENMVGMGATNLPSKALRTQISSAVNMIVQISRMRDGMRRITHVSEIVGMEGDVIVTQDLYHFEYQGEDEHGILIGDFKSTGLRPHFAPRAAYFGLEQALLETL